MEAVWLRSFGLVPDNSSLLHSFLDLSFGFVPTGEETIACGGTFLPYPVISDERSVLSDKAGSISTVPTRSLLLRGILYTGA